MMTLAKRLPRPAGGQASGPFMLVAGLVLLAVITLLATTALSVGNLFVYDSVLLASLGAIALTVLTGTAGQVSIGNSAFLAIGGFGTVWAMKSGVPFPFDIVVATLITGAFGLIVGLPGVRLRGLELALATLAAYFIVQWATNQYEIETPGGSAGFTIPTLFESKGLVGGQKYWAWLLFLVLVVVIVGARLLSRGKMGRALRIIRDHELIAPSLGVPVTRYKLSIFALSSAVIGLEGSLFAYFIGSVTSGTYTLTLAIQYLAMVIIGGLDSITGAIIGAAIVTALPTIMTNVLTPVMGTQAAIDAPQIASIASFALLILMLTLAPEGIAPWAGRLFTARGSGGDGDDSGTDAGTRFGPDKARNPLTSLIGRERQGSQKSSFLIRR
jgi:branched-chain amino acid transport system permease protein